MSKKTPKGKPVTKSDRLRNELNKLHGSHGKTWRAIARLDKYDGVPAGTLCSFAKGATMPHEYCARFGLPDERPAPVCLKCGDVHTTKRCTKNKQARRPRPRFDALTVAKVRMGYET